MKRRRQRIQPVLRRVHRSGRQVTTESAAASEVVWAVDDVQCQSAPGAVCKLSESTDCEGASDTDSHESDAPDACRVHRCKPDRHRVAPVVVWASVTMREIVVISESLRNTREARFLYRKERVFYQSGKEASVRSCGKSMTSSVLDRHRCHG